MSNDLKDRDEYSNFLRHLRQERQETSNFAKTVLIIISVLCGMIIGFLFLADNETITDSISKNKNQSVFVDFLSKFSTKKQKKQQFTMPMFKRNQTILLVGVDANGDDTDPWKNTRTDTIVLLNIDARTKSINAVSVPRDSKVFISDEIGIQKINSAHALGGIELTRKTIEDTLGIRIDNYIMVNDLAVSNMVDSIGGVPIYVEKEMHYHDYAGKLHINLHKGLNILDGNNAVGYLRYRKDGLGDIGRTQRQQWFLKGLLEKLQSPQAITKIPDLITTLSKYVKTDMSLYEISQYASLVRNINMDKIEFATLPGAPNQKGSISYWILDPEKTQEVINRMIYRDRVFTQNMSELSAGVIYSGRKESQADLLKSELEELGIEVACFYSADFTHSQFIGQSSNITNEFFNWVKDRVSYINRIQFVYDPVRNLCPKSDFTIILAGD